MKKLLVLSALALGAPYLSADCESDCKGLMTTLIPRSQERNRPQQLVGLCEKTYMLDAGPFYGNAAVTGAYSRTFKAKHIAEAFFGKALFCNDEHPYLKIQGNSYLGDDRDPKALFADYFYLPQDYSAQVFFSPRIQNYSVDLDVYLGLNNLCDGLYMRIHSPLVHTQWNLNLCENIITPGSVAHTYGYFTPDILPASKLLSRFEQYASGDSPINLPARTFANPSVGIIDVDGDVITGPVTFNAQPSVFNGLAYAQLPGNTKRKTGLADIRVEVGNVFKETDTYSISANLQLLIPTGTKKKAKYLFEPVIGNGRHWEFGGGLQGDYTFYKNSANDSHASFHGDFNITHLFKTNQKRTFDLKNKELSRYMLASRFTYAVESFPVGGGADPLFLLAQFAHEYTPVANISTLDVSVSVAVQIDASAFVHYQKKHWDFDFGYNVWYRSQEKLTCQPTTSCCDDLNPLSDAQSTNRWGLKGDARMYTFPYNTDATPDRFSDPRPLSSTESQATIYQGTNKVAINCDAGAVNDNFTVDNSQPLPSGVSNFLSCPTTSDSKSINTSIDPIFIQKSDLDIAGNSGLSHKIFANTAYSGKWRDYKTTFCLGASAEFGMKDNDNHTNLAVSQWAVWIKGALAFD